MIYHYSPKIVGNELEYVKKSIQDGWICLGSNIVKFENKIKNYVKSKYSVAVNSGTAALHLSLILSKVEKGDEVIVPSLTFISPVNTILYCGASPIFMDCDNFFNIDQTKTIEFIEKNTYYKNGFTYNKKTQKKIKALIIVHVWGNACEVDKLVPILKKRNIKLIEDASEALGTKYIKGKFKNKFAGTIGDFGCFSFNMNKIITTGQGGMLLSNKKNMAKKAKYLSSQAKNDSFAYVHNEVGYHYRLNNILAGIGLAQFKNLKLFIKRKKYINNFFKNKLSNNKFVKIAPSPKFANNNFWHTIFLIKDFKFKKKLINEFNKNKIQTRLVWLPNHRQKHLKYFQKFKVKNADRLVKQSICAPCGNHITDHNLNLILKIINKISL